MHKIWDRIYLFFCTASPFMIHQSYCNNAQRQKEKQNWKCCFPETVPKESCFRFPQQREMNFTSQETYSFPTHNHVGGRSLPLKTRREISNFVKGQLVLQQKHHLTRTNWSSGEWKDRQKRRCALTSDLRFFWVRGYSERSCCKQWKIVLSVHFLLHS